jgi:hypothetical protein
VATDRHAEVVDLGTIGTRQADSAQLVRTRQANATHLICVDDAGPWGDWLSRDLTNKGHRGWGVAPSRLSGDRASIRV